MKSLSLEYHPVFDVYNAYFVGIGDSKIGNKVRMIINYKVREKTKNYVILQIIGAMAIKSKRMF